MNLTYQEIGNQMGLTHTGVRKIEKRALEKLRKLINLQEYLGDSEPHARYIKNRIVRGD